MVAFNKVIVAGNLSRDIELRHLPNGTAVTDASLAINSQWKGKDGQKHEEVTFVDCTLWGKTAELAADYLKKGSSVLFEGSLKQESWEDKTSGQKRSKIKVNVDSMQFLGEKSASGGNRGGGNDDRHDNRNGGGNGGNNAGPRQRYNR
jgi:single-strand DNA-binding protein